jgi:chemotaxis protein MotA
MNRHHARSFLLRWAAPAGGRLLFETELETLHEEEHQPITLLERTSNALPGLAIVAAVLGIVITMGHRDGASAPIDAQNPKAAANRRLSLLALPPRH